MVHYGLPEYILKADIEAMREASARMRRLTESLDEERGRLDANRRTHSQGWTGLPADAFCQSFAIWNGRYGWQATVARMIAGELDEIIDGYVDTSRRVNALWNGGGRDSARSSL